MSERRIITSPDQLDYSKLLDIENQMEIVPAICVDAARLALDSILMVACANRAAIQKTLDTRRATFWSRSQSGLWTKGETSGNFLLLNDIYTDCDNDAVIYDVSPIGPTCHTGADTCFDIPNSEKEKNDETIR